MRLGVRPHERRAARSTAWTSSPVSWCVPVRATHREQRAGPRQATFEHVEQRVQLGDEK